MLSRGKTPTGEPHTVSHPKLRALHRAERLAVTWSAVAVVGCSMAVSGCGSARVVTGRTTTPATASRVPVAQTSTTVTETATTAPPNNTPSAASQQPSGGLLTRRQVKAAEAAGAAIIADCNAQYAGTETYAQGSAAVNATFVLQAAYEREANTPYPNFIKRGAKP